MSMQVDLSTPLSAEEREYLAMRGRYAEIARAEQLTGEAGQPFGEGDGTGPVQQPLGTAEYAAGERDRLLARLKELEEEKAARDAEDGEDEIPPYTEWTSPDLNAEIDRRNEDRPDNEKISKAGSIQSRADRLYADDAANA